MTVTNVGGKWRWSRDRFLIDSRKTLDPSPSIFKSQQGKSHTLNDCLKLATLSLRF